MNKLNKQDQELINIAKQTIKKLVSEKKHNLSTAIRISDGQIITGINMAGSFGCNDICSEQITLGKSLSEGHSSIDTLVTVRHPKKTEANKHIAVVNPCGKCRELLIDYAPNSYVIIRDEKNNLIKVKANDLIPNRYKR